MIYCVENLKYVGLLWDRFFLYCFVVIFYYVNVLVSCVCELYDCNNFWWFIDYVNVNF